MPIIPVSPLVPSLPSLPSLPDIQAPQAPQPGSGGAVSDFTKVLSNTLGQVEGAQQSADAAQSALATGKTNDVTSVVLATEKASVDINLATQVRNKLTESYMQIMQMQV